MKFKEKHKLRMPSGSYVVGSTSFHYEYEQNEQQGEKRVIPCLCFYPATEIEAGHLKKYVREEILPGTSGIETNSYINVPVADGTHPLLLFNMATVFLVKLTLFSSRSLLLTVILYLASGI